MKRNGGFSLVELMVAMVVGLIIILGAGQLFLTVFQTNRQVEVLSEKQAAVNFAVETLLRDVRRADPDTIKWKEGGGTPTLEMTVSNSGDMAVTSCGAGEDVSKTYRLDESDSRGWALEVAQACSSVPPASGFSEIVSAFASNGFNVNDSGANDGVWVVNFDLMATDGDSGASDSLVFHAVNRTAAVIP